MCKQRAGRGRVGDPTVPSQPPAAGPHERAVPQGLRVATGWTWRLIVLGAGAFLLVRVLAPVGLVVVALLVAFLLAAFLSPGARALRALGAPPALAAIAVVGGGLIAFGGVIALIVPAVAGELDDVRDRVAEGIERVSRSAGDLGLAGADSDVLFTDNLADWLRDNVGRLGAGALSGALIAIEVLAGALLCLVLTFFLVKDGETMWRWFVERLPRSHAPDAEKLGRRLWASLGAYVRGLVIIAAFDAVFIGLGLLAIGVPLVVPLAVLTFVGAFVPVFGALLAGGAATLVALVSGGIQDALLVIVITVVVQQVESNILQPVVMSRALPLHPMVVLLAVTTGGLLAGIVGAALATPLVAAGVLTGGFLRERSSPSTQPGRADEQPVDERTNDDDPADAQGRPA
ncbi:MAG TPA: AI-2E family transporter [Solirubrobacteraceae bacterium]|nr:AI-2E family transporter [Solirubrobacteraceae bacterium]